MTFDKVKAMRNAERFLAQGKIRAAISEYKRVVEADKNDFSTLNMLGDLHAKASETDEAVKCFMVVAEHYRKQDFSQKAIAIYNKIVRLKPDSLEVSAKLAQLYQMKGSLAEARVHYNTLAEQYTKTGKKAEALSVWKQIAILDPKDADIYLKIADACWQDQQKDEAATAYVEAGTRLNAKKQYESAVTAFSRALEITPDDVKALKGFVETQMNLGYTEEAAKSLEGSLARQPHNREIIYLLIDCHINNGNLAEAEREVVKLVENEPSNFPKLLDVVEAYLKTNNIESATRILAMASEHMLVGGLAIELGDILERILAVDSEYVVALRLLVRFHAWQRDEASMQTALERLAEAAKNNDKPDDEVYALTQLVMIVPQNSYFPERLHELSTLGYTEALDAPVHAGDVPTFESYSGLGDLESERFAPDTTFGEYDPDLNSTNGNGSLAEDENSIDYAENGFDYTAEFSGEEHTEIASNDVADEVEYLDSETAESGRTLSDFERHNLQTDLEGVTFYIEQGYFDLAEKTIVELENNYGIQPEINEVKSKLETSPAPTDVSDENASHEENAESIEGETKVEEGESNVAVEDEEAQTADTEDQASGFDAEASEEAAAETSEAFEETSEEIAEKASFDADGTQSLAGIAEGFEDSAVEDSVREEGAASESEVETVSEAYDEIAEEPVAKDATEEIDAVETPEVAEETEEIAKANIEDVKATSDDQYEVHYQTGVVYKEMGLVEDSIREFQDAVKLVSANDGTKRYFWSCNLLAHTFMEKGMPSIAIMWYKRCLNVKDLDAEELNGLYYELGNAYEKAGDKENAQKNFEEVYALDVDFRDVGKRLESLLSS